MLIILMIKVTISSEEINSDAALLLIGKLLDVNSPEHRPAQASNVKYSSIDSTRTAIFFMCLRNSDFPDVQQFREDGLFRHRQRQS